MVSWSHWNHWVALFVASVVLNTHVAALTPTAQFERLLDATFNEDSRMIPVTGGDLSLFDGPRDYYTLVVFTSTDPRHECDLCHDLPNIVSTVALSWFADYAHTNMLYIANVDVIDRKNIDIFNTAGIETIPQLRLVPPSDTADYDNGMSLVTTGHYDFKIPIASLEEQSMELARFLTHLLQKSITIRPENPTVKFVKTFIGTFSAILFLKKKGPEFFTRERKYGWAIFILLLTLTFLGGYQFTVSEGVPFLARNDKNEFIYISGGTTYQFGVEIVLVAANYLALGMTVVVMIYIGAYKVSATSQIRRESTKVLLVVASNVVLYLLYSCLTSMYLRKDPWYPYGITKLF